MNERILRGKALAAIALAACLSIAFTFAAHAQTIRVANQGDALSLDPHSLNEIVQLSLTGNVYEGLVGFDKALNVVPALATEWQQTAPNVWRFTLRQGVQFHDGTPFTADDVLFSFTRAAAESSDLRDIVKDFTAVRRVDDYTVDIETLAPYPILPRVIASIYMMSQRWSTENQALVPVDRRTGVENAASFSANGTGPFRVVERQPDVRTVFARNDHYWGEIEGNVKTVIFTPISNDATRVAALLSGAVDVVDPVPLQDVARINANASTHVVVGPELRTMFFALDQGRDELLFSNVKGKNPFKDQRVRQAFYQAINIDAINKTVMRGAVIPSGAMITPGVGGWDERMRARLPYDPEAAKKLLAEAGYPQGFELTMHCSNDRYVNDSRVCQAVAANLARVGVKVSLQTETKGTYFPRIRRREASFFLLGWLPVTYDAHNVLTTIIACVDGKGAGQVNLGSYCNPKVDALTHAIQTENDPVKRNAMIYEALELHAQDVGHIPLYQQTLAWGMTKKVTLAQRADNFMQFKWMSMVP